MFVWFFGVATPGRRQSQRGTPGVCVRLSLQGTHYDFESLVEKTLGAPDRSHSLPS